VSDGKKQFFKEDFELGMLYITGSSFFYETKLKFEVMIGAGNFSSISMQAASDLKVYFYFLI